MLDSRYMHVAYDSSGDYWEATSLVNGAVYRVRGRSPYSTFQEMCQMRRLPDDRWRFTLVAPGAIQCEHRPPDEPELKESETVVDMPGAADDSGRCTRSDRSCS